MDETKKKKSKKKILIIVLIIVAIIAIVAFIALKIYLDRNFPDLRDDNPYDIYGRYVNYEVEGIPENIKWRIYYTDSENIYLVTDKNIEVDRSMNENAATREELEQYFDKEDVEEMLNEKIYDIDLASYSEKYKGSEDITDSKILKYSKWIRKYPTNTENNTKSVAFILDKNKWSKYCNNYYSEYAVGSSSLDMLVNSFNKVHDRKLECTLTDIGHKVKFEDEEDYKSEFILNELQYDVDKKSQFEDLYNLADSTNPEEDNEPEEIDENEEYARNEEPETSIWIAGNSAADENSVYQLSSKLCTEKDYYMDVAGFRPVVCLKSAARLKERADGTYDIIYNEWTEFSEKITFKWNSKKDELKIQNDNKNGKNSKNGKSTANSKSGKSMSDGESGDTDSENGDDDESSTTRDCTYEDVEYTLSKGFKKEYGLPYSTQAGDDGKIYYKRDISDTVEYYCIYLNTFPEEMYTDEQINNGLLELNDCYSVFDNEFITTLDEVKKEEINGHEWITRKVSTHPDPNGSLTGDFALPPDTEYNYVTKYNGKIYFAQFWIGGEEFAELPEILKNVAQSLNFKE